jgi:hypothetical protein
MSHLLDEILGRHPKFGELTERDLLIHIVKGLHAMALDLSALTAAVAKVSTDVDALIVSHGTAATQLAADQAAVDALVPTVTAVSTKVEAALAPAPAAAPAA